MNPTKKCNTPDENLERLIRCFSSVFANLNRGDIVEATHENITEWDSIAQITLLTVIGEEFGLDIDFEQFEEATSFETILELVQRNHG